MSIDVIQTASQKTQVDYTESHHATAGGSSKKGKTNKKAFETEKKVNGKDETSRNGDSKNYGSIKDDETKEEDVTDLETAGEDDNLLQQTDKMPVRHLLIDSNSSSRPGTWSFRLQCVLLVIPDNWGHERNPGVKKYISANYTTE